MKSNLFMFSEEIERRPEDEDKSVQLNEAALSGSLPALTNLIRNDPQILHRVSLSSKLETPLHISALSGHFDFTKALLDRKPELASPLDSSKCSPLHLASAEGHIEIVKALLRANIEVCLVADEEGRIPLHLAAMRGKVDVIKELVDAKPDSIHQKLNGSSILHLCVQYNQLEALKQLVTLVDENQLLEFRNHGGNTVLHLAVMLRQLESIKYLVSLPEIKANINILNRMGLSALDLLEYYPRDFKSLEIGDVLIKAGSRRSNDEDPNPPNTVPNQSQMVQVAVGGETQVIAVNSRSFRCWLKGKIKSGYHKCKKYLKRQSDWVEKMQGTLMLVATLTATISFQVAVNPPGGVWQQDYEQTSDGGFYCNMGKYGKCLAGTAVMAYVLPDEYFALTSYAVVSFIASMSVVLLAISGLPLKNKLFTRLMTIAMIFAITFLLNAFLEAIRMLTPDPINFKIEKAFIVSGIIWTVLVLTIILFGTIHLLFWLISYWSKFKRFARKKLSRPNPIRNEDPIC
ncbi:hypothetical protein PTKIN_Ptkin13bG0103700 [Pterospermum kingtungense]